MDDQLSATIDEAGDGRVIFNANLTSVHEDFDGTEFTVEADYGAYSDSTSFILSAYKLPVLETTLLIDSVNENFNETVRLIDCSLYGKLFADKIPIFAHFLIQKLVINQKNWILVPSSKMSLSRLVVLN